MGAVVTSCKKDELSQIEKAYKLFNSKINNDHFIYDVYVCQLTKFPEMQQCLDIKDISSPTENERRKLGILSRSVRDFLRICLQHSLHGRKVALESCCMLAGSRHVKYTQEKQFQPYHWDAFLVATTDLLRAENQKEDAIEAWREFMRSVINNMNLGYGMASGRGHQLNKDDLVHSARGPPSRMSFV